MKLTEEQKEDMSWRSYFVNTILVWILIGINAWIVTTLWNDNIASLVHFQTHYWLTFSIGYVVRYVTPFRIKQYK